MFASPRLHLCLVIISIAFWGCKKSNKNKTSKATQRPLEATLTKPTEKKYKVLQLVDLTGDGIEGIEVFIKGNESFALGTSNNEGYLMAKSPLPFPATVIFKSPKIVQSFYEIKKESNSLKIFVPQKKALDLKFSGQDSSKNDFKVFLHDGSENVQSIEYKEDQKVKTVNISEGYYKAWATGRSGTSRVIDINLTEPTRVDFKIIKGYQIKGTLEGRDFPKNGNIIFSPQEKSLPTLIAPIQPNGEFALEGIPAGSWKAFLESPNYYSDRTKVFTLSKSIEGLKVNSSPKKNIRGKVTDPQGNPLEGVQISILDPLRANTSPMRNDLPWVHPLAGPHPKWPVRKSRKFGAHRPGNRPLECIDGHCGIDIGKNLGDNVYASASGIVEKIQRLDQGRAGKFIKLNHRDQYYTWYVHLDTINNSLKVGTAVSLGDQIGTLGKSGIKKSKPHLHFGLAIQRKKRAFYIDPEYFLKNVPVKKVDTNVKSTHSITIHRSSPQIVASSIQKPQFSRGTWTAFSDRKGHFNFKGVSSNLTKLLFEHAKFQSYRSNFDLAKENTELLRVQLQPLIQRRGIIMTTDGPALDATIECVLGDHDGRTILSVARALKDGTFEIDTPPPPFKLIIKSPEHGGKSLDINTNKPDLGKIFLEQKAGMIKLRILDGNGQQGREAVASLTTELNKQSTRHPADSEGLISISNLEEKYYAITLDAPWSYPQKMQIQAKNHWQDVEMFFGMKVDLPTRLENGEIPPKGTRFSIRKKGLIEYCQTDHNGHCLFRSLAQGKWKIFLEAKNYAPYRQDIVIPPALKRHQIFEAEIATLLDGVSIEGIVRNSNGERLSNTFITIGDRQTQTDIDGHYKIERVGYGEFEVRIKHAEMLLKESLSIRSGNRHRTRDFTFAIQDTK